MDKGTSQMSDFEIMTLSGLGVFMVVMGALVYVMTREDNDHE